MARPADSNTIKLEATDSSRADWLAQYPPPRSLPLDQEALRVYELAYAIGQLVDEKADESEKGAPPVSFGSVVAALLAARNRTSNWFFRQSRSLGPHLKLVAGSLNLTQEEIERLTPPTGQPETIRLSKGDNQLFTSSARAVIQNAEEWAHRSGSTDIGVRHLVAAYVLNPPPYHRDELKQWEFQESGWRQEFFGWVSRFYTAEMWGELTNRPAPTKAIPLFEQQEIKGEKIAFPGDSDVTAVLSLAASFHQRRPNPRPGPDKGIGLTTVFFGLIETARTREDVQSAIAPIWKAVDQAREPYEAMREKLVGPPIEGAKAASFDKTNVSPAVLNMLETARELATVTRRDANDVVVVAPIHLAGALLSRRVDADTELTSMGIMPLELRRALIQRAGDGPVGEAWRESLGEEESVQLGRPVELNSDEPEAVVAMDEDFATDPLLIRRDVESFAALLASKNLEPPLSIGLFGPWGSGKTTFLRRLRRAVDQRTKSARDAKERSETTGFVNNVVHVEFNAWHFSESALISSLVDTILRALSAYIKNEKQPGALAWQELKLKELESTRRSMDVAGAVKEAADRAVKDAQTALSNARQEAQQKLTSLAALAQDVWTATRKELLGKPAVQNSGVLEAVGEVVAGRDQLEAQLRALRARPARMLSDLGWARSLFFALLILAVPPAVAWVVARYLTDNQTTQALSTMTAILSMLGLWLRAANRAVTQADAVIATVVNTYENRLNGEDKVMAAQSEVDAAQAKAATAAQNLEAAQLDLARARAEAANAALPMQMLRLASRRIEDGAYNKELTTLSLARADLQALTEILKGQRETITRPATSDNQPAARSVDRIVLYIDDLDRCQPEDVVRVLQMVHMLLAFELFVVVVAVDARWVEECLRNSYKWLSSERPVSKGDGGTTPGAPVLDGRPVTPQDYLEKIFQISFWLEPMTAPRAALYLASLVRPSSIANSNAANAAANPSDTDAAGPNASRIELTELDYMRALSAYVGPSPRRVKRLVNAYRLIRARMSDTQLTAFVSDRTLENNTSRSGPYQIVIALLVIGTGAPSASARILKELSEWDPGDGLDAVVTRFRSQNDPDWTMAAKVIETLMRTQNANDVSELRGWARNVGRFLLNAPTDELPSRIPAPTAQPSSPS